jgi:transcriptional regulator with XRE-family HTH domain
MAVKIPSRVQTFPELIRWLVKGHHDGVVVQLCRRIGISSALGQQWVSGLVRNPQIDSLTRLADAYDLDFDDVRRLVTRPRPETTPAPIKWEDGCTICPAHQAELRVQFEREAARDARRGRREAKDPR